MEFNVEVQYIVINELAGDSLALQGGSEFSKRWYQLTAKAVISWQYTHDTESCAVGEIF